MSDTDVLSLDPAQTPGSCDVSDACDDLGVEAVRSGLSIRKTARLFGVSPAKVQRVLAA